MGEFLCLWGKNAARKAANLTLMIALTVRAPTVRAPTAKAGRVSRRRLPRLFSSVAPELAAAGGGRRAHIELLFWGVRPYRGMGVDHCLLLPLELAGAGSR